VIQLTPTFFKDQYGFRKWLLKNHMKESELLVGFYKKESGKANMTWSQSVDEALCFGWIDGVRRSIDENSYCIRFTPRKPNSNWSSININKVEELIKLGLMQAAGLKVYKQRKKEKSSVASYESEAKQLDKQMAAQFMANKTAWEYFTKQAPSYQRMIIHWILSAKQEKTRMSRLEKTIIESEEHRRMFQL
jgi:uncharacterized protein YdeI (YjbR/CyaY-like superfamily)